MMKKSTDFQILFVWRRAFRSPTGAVVRSDVVEALAISTTAASTLLTSAVATSDRVLERVGNKIIAATSARAPHWADETDLMEALNSKKTSFADSGLRPTEPPVNFTSWHRKLPLTPGTLKTLIDACTRKQAALIEYVGLDMGKTTRCRRVFPVALERIGGQWRLLAQDLDTVGSPKSAYFLSRIVCAKPDPAVQPTFERAVPKMQNIG